MFVGATFTLKEPKINSNWADIHKLHNIILLVGVTGRFGEKITQIEEKVAKTVAKSKTPKYLYQSLIWKSKTSSLNHFEPLKYIKQTMLWNSTIRVKIKKNASEKNQPPKVTTFLATNFPQKLAWAFKN